MNKILNEEKFKEYCEKQVARIAKGYNTITYLDDKNREVIWGVGGEKMYILSTLKINLKSSIV